MRLVMIFYLPCSDISVHADYVMQDISELRNELQRKEVLIQKHLNKIHHWQQVLEDINVQHKKPTELPQGPLAFLEQASANLPAPMKPN